MRLKLAIGGLALMLMPVVALAQGTPSAPDGTAERFLETLKAGKAGDALSVLTRGSRMLTARLAADPTVATQVDSAITLYGPVLSWERINSEAVGTLVRRDTYLVQHRDMVTRWRFIYVRGARDWTLSFFVFEDQIPNWFENK